MNDTVTLSRSIEDWRSAEAPGPVAIVCGYSDEEFGEALAVSARPNQFRLLCDKAFADDVTRMANERLKNPPRFRLAGRFRPYVLTAQRVGDDRALAVPFKRIVNHLLTGTRRARLRSELLFGAADPEDRVAIKIVEATRRLVESLAAFSATDILLCDPGGDCLRQKGGLAHLITRPGFDLDAAGDFAAAEVKPLDWGPSEETRILSRAAFFLGQSEEEIGPNLDPRDEDGVLAAMLVDWRAEMRMLAESSINPEARKTGAKALEKLNAAFGDM